MSGTHAACLLVAFAGGLARWDDAWAQSPTMLDAAVGIDSDYEVSPDGQWVVFRAAHDAEEPVQELLRVPLTGETPVTLNRSLVSHGNVESWRFTSDGSRVAYWADAEEDGRTEVYSVSIADGSWVKLNPELVGIGSTGGAIAQDHVVFIASERLDTFGTFFDLFGVPATGGSPTTLDESLDAGEDVHQVLARADLDRVLYLANQDSVEVEDLYSVSADGGTPIKLDPTLATNGNVLADGLQFSPDGNYVLYAADQDQDSVVEIYRVPTLGGTATKLNAPLALGGDVTAGSQRFGPDGSQVIYRADQNADEVFEVFSVPSTGGSPVRLNGPLVDGGDVRQQGLQFSPDGTRVLYLADQDTDSVIELYSVLTSGESLVKLSGPLTAGGDVADDPIFSPDGSRVLYRADQDVDDQLDLYCVPSAGGTSIRLNETLVPDGDVVRAAFTPAGDQVVYLADQDTDGVFELFAVPIDGGACAKTQRAHDHRRRARLAVQPGRRNARLPGGTG